MRAEASSRFAPRVVGVVHLPALPGTARGEPATAFGRVLDVAKCDAAAYAEGGADAIIVENFGDIPFARERVGPGVIAAMALAVSAARAESGLPVGVNILRNDVCGAIAVAALCGARFVRANVYVGAAVTDQGLIEGRADEAQTLIRQLGGSVDVWADIDVKHAAPLAPRPLGDLAADAIERGLAAAVIVTGRGTGHPAAELDLRAVRDAMPQALLYAGSGVTAASIGVVLRYADGAIVGTAAKVDGQIGNPVDPVRVRSIVAATRSGE
ncbi:MAG: BtpA/SgcQ family protein [Chloroflexota bacterium]|nr:BtpA/SgcQ family protein [Chloroflexota bacterium]